MGIQNHGIVVGLRSVGSVKALPVSPYWEVLDADEARVPSVERYLQDFWARALPQFPRQAQGDAACR